MKLAYIGIDALYPALPALARAGCEIAEVFTCETDNVTEFNLQVRTFAGERGLPLTVGRVTGADLDRLKAAGCRAAVCGGYYHRLPVDPALPMVNIHPALLPVGRGAWPMPVALLRGLGESGVTLHKIDGGFDTGDILLQEAAPILPEDTLETLTDRLRALLPGMMARLIADFDGLWANARPQGPGETWPCPDEKDYPITPETGWREADRILRAFYGYECIYLDADRPRGLLRGRAFPGPWDGAGLPVKGGVIRAEGVREL